MQVLKLFYVTQKFHALLPHFTAQKFKLFVTLLNLGKILFKLGRDWLSLLRRARVEPLLLTLLNLEIGLI